MSTRVVARVLSAHSPAWAAQNSIAPIGCEVAAPTGISVGAIGVIAQALSEAAAARYSAAARRRSVRGAKADADGIWQSNFCMFCPIRETPEHLARSRGVVFQLWLKRRLTFASIY